jgi:hypothetical protein
MASPRHSCHDGVDGNEDRRADRASLGAIGRPVEFQ